MKVIIAPDSFGDTLSTLQAAQYIAQGWLKIRPEDTIFLLPQSDGGPGFLEVLRTQGGEIFEAQITDVLGKAYLASWLQESTPSATICYMESAITCGLAQLPFTPNPDTALQASSYGLGELVLDCLQAFHAKLDKYLKYLMENAEEYSLQIVIGLGGTASSDGGRGFMEALAMQPRGYIYGHDATNDSGVSSGMSAYNPSTAEISTRSQEVLQVAAQKIASVSKPSRLELIAATDVDNPLLGPLGVAGMFSAQKGADLATQHILEERNTVWAQELALFASQDIAHMPGAGAGGGLGAAILALGGKRVSGAELINHAVYQAHDLQSADLIITGEGKFDAQSLHGKTVAAIVTQFASLQIPVIVIAGQVELSTDEYYKLGISRTYSLSEYVGSIDIAMRDAAKICESIASCVALDWNAGRINLPAL